MPPHRYTPLKENWELIYEPLVEQMGLQVRMNVKKRTVELRVSIRSLFLFTATAPRPNQSSGCLLRHRPLTIPWRLGR